VLIQAIDKSLNCTFRRMTKQLATAISKAAAASKMDRVERSGTIRSLLRSNDHQPITPTTFDTAVRSRTVLVSQNRILMNSFMDYKDIIMKVQPHE
jgi:hypothetical protein